jgi:hypothetical protein
MPLHSWLRNLRSALAPRRGRRKHARPGSKRAPTHRPGLEALEDRWVPTFLAPVNYDVLASYALDAKTGDFNGDAILDLATVGQDGIVNVLLGNPDGTFQPARWTSAGTSAAEPSLAVGDFNEDGKLDLATNSNYYAPAQYGYDDVVVLLGHGDGTFLPHRLGTDLAGAVVATDDVNGDGHVDLVVASWNEPFSVLLGRGDGTFAPAAPYDGPFPEAFSHLALADFDGDGNLDQASPAAGGLTVSLGNGDGSFAPPIGIPIGHTPTFLVVADFNADGRPDAAALQPGNFGDNPYGVVTVLLNDGVWPPPPGPSAPSITIDDRALSEGNTGTTSATFTVTLSAPYDQPVTVAYTIGGGTATAGSDYQSAFGTLIIPAGQTTGTITVPVNGDRFAETNETFYVRLIGATNATIADDLGVGTILDDEPRISIGDVRKAEGKKGKTAQFTFTVTLSAAYDQAVTVSFSTANGTARTGDNDYVAKSGTITFAPGETTKTITIEVEGDSKREADETFFVDLTGIGTNLWLTKSRGIGTILNDD